MRSPQRKTVLFLGQPHPSQASLYKAAIAVRDGADEAFGLHASTLTALLRSACELPTDPDRTLRLRRVKSATVKRSFFHLVADLSDGTTTGELSPKKACRAAFSTSTS